MRVIDRIAQALANTGAPGTFATRRTASAAELRLDVVGVGPIPLPLSPASARRLCGIAHLARYGLRDQTLLDRNVRDAWEIGKRQVKIDARRWRRTLDPELERIARDLEACAPGDELFRSGWQADAGAAQPSRARDRSSKGLYNEHPSWRSAWETDSTHSTRSGNHHCGEGLSAYKVEIIHSQQDLGSCA
jgi:hypothetical protein